MSSPAVTLFSEAIDQDRRPVTVVASAVIHVAVISLVSFGILNAPKIDTRVAERYTVRTLDFHMPPPPIRRAANKIDFPGQHHPKTAAPAHAAGGSAPPPPVTAQAPIGPQTLIQPDLPKQLALQEELPVPQMLIWTPRVKVVQKIVAPTPQPNTTAEAKPTLQAPNQETNLADVNLAASLAQTETLHLMPSTTTPIVVHGPKLPQSTPSTVTQTTAAPTPTAILSASDLHMDDGAADLPPVNESARADQPDTLGDPGLAPGKGAGSGNGSDPGAGQGSAPAGAAQPSSADGLGQANAATQITLPRNGQFGAVVIGAALQDQFPELAGLWGGRMAYTVYLHVGLARSWILEYSLPGAATVLAGNGERLEAPWPYSIVRPNLGAGDINADALMVHGFVNQAGQFEALSVVFPQAFPQAQFVLQSLAHWQFRPAIHNGSNARVEVLLIIPEELD
jgi:hypothetical protein